MYERFTDRARKVMQLANQEAQRLNHEYIGTEHILLGLVKEGSGVASHVIRSFGLDITKIREETERVIAAGPDMVTMGKLPQTPRAKKVIEYAIDEASHLNHGYVGTEHLLLGLLKESEGVAAAVLTNLGLNLQDVRAEVLFLLGHGVDPEEVTATPSPREWGITESTLGSWRLHPSFSVTSAVGACCPEDIPKDATFTRTHKFWLRDDFEVEIVLPKDITPTEVDRLCQFVGLITE